MSDDQASAAAGEEFHVIARTGPEPRTIRRLTRLSPLRSSLAIAQTAAIIAVAVAASQVWPHPLVYAAAVVAMAGQQHALAILAHEAVHYRLFGARWLNEAIRVDPNGRRINQVASTLNVLRGNWARAVEIAQKVLADNPRNGWYVAYLSDFYLQSGHVADALALYEAGYPELMTAMNPGVRRNNATMAIILARLQQEAGNTDMARKLMERSLEVYEASRIEGMDNRFLTDVQIYAVMGEKEKALHALRTAIDSGWRFLSFYMFSSAKTLDSIRNEREFIAMVEEVNADLARQRESLKIKWAAEFDQI